MAKIRGESKFWGYVGLGAYDSDPPPPQSKMRGDAPDKLKSWVNDCCKRLGALQQGQGERRPVDVHARLHVDGLPFVHGLFLIATFETNQLSVFFCKFVCLSSLWCCAECINWAWR